MHAAIPLLSLFPAGWQSEVCQFDEETANQAVGSELGPTNLLEPKGANRRNA